MEAIVLAGGFGTRLSHIVKDVPKPMASVAGHPFLKYIADELIRQGVTRLVFAVHYKKEIIMDYFGASYRGIPVSYSVEDTPLFTGGAVKKALEACTESCVWVINGDTFFQVPMADMAAFATQMKAAAAIAVKEMVEFSRYGKVDVAENGAVLKFHEKEYCQRGWINGGIYYLDREILKDYPEKFSLEQACFPRLLEEGKLFAFPSSGYFIDIGIPEDYEEAQSVQWAR